MQMYIYKYIVNSIFITCNVCFFCSSFWISRIVLPIKINVLKILNPNELCKCHWSKIQDYFCRTAGCHFMVVDLIKQLILVRLKLKGLSYETQALMGYWNASEFKKNKFNFESLKPDQIDKFTNIQELYSIVASVLVQFQNSILNLNRNDIEQIYDLIETCFYPSETCVEGPTATNGEGDKLHYAPWVRGWINRARIMMQMSIVARLSQQPHYKDSENRGTLADQIKQALIEYEKFLYYQKKVIQDSLFMKFLVNHRKELELLKSSIYSTKCIDNRIRHHWNLIKKSKRFGKE